MHSGLLGLCQFLDSPDGALDNAKALHNADDTGHGNAADADRTRVGAENILRRESGSLSLRQHVSDKRNNEEPHQERAAANNEGVFKADDIAVVLGAMASFKA